jgi:tRNA pseudouridine55 synthase
MDKINYDSVIKEGVILPIYKPLMWTSFDVVKFIRNLLKKTYKLKKIKVGHAGTLDPLATGLLVLCIGKKTKEINKIQEENKTYLATIKVGESTPSYDRETEIDNIYPTSHINEELIIDSIKSFKGKSEQTPPVYSALKIDGKRSYELARKGEKIIPKKREIEIFKFNLLNFKNLEIDCEIECSKGTYIRSIASDMGKKLNSGAYLKYLERYSVGEYSIKNCLQIDEIKDLLSLH